MASTQDEKLLALQGRIDKLQVQKDTLLKELDEIEEKYEKTDRLYKKYFPLIIDTLATDDSSFGKACKNLGAALKKGDSSGKVEYIFEQIKNIIVKEDPLAGEPKKKKGLFSSILKGSSTSFLDDFKQGYHEIVNSLKSSLGAEYNKKLDRITTLINKVEGISDLNDVRDIIFKVINGYIYDTTNDREKVASFVQEVVGKIFEIEAALTQSFEQTGGLLDSNTGFETVLGSQITAIKENSKVAPSLEELKKSIAQRLAAIEKALKEKKAKDDAVKNLVQNNQKTFKAGFTKLKLELDEVTKHSKELEKKLNQDQLTGAYNRRAYDKKIEDEMARFLRYHTPFSLLMIDADKFKNLNDKYGHAIGDKCLQEIIKRTMPLLRKNDMLARYGGEEFTVIMPETPKEGAREAAEKIRQTIEKIEFVYKKEKVRVTVSIGVAQSEEGEEKHEAIFERADIAVYKAKENGRNQVFVN